MAKKKNKVKKVMKAFGLKLKITEKKDDSKDGLAIDPTITPPEKPKAPKNPTNIKVNVKDNRGSKDESKALAKAVEKDAKSRGKNFEVHRTGVLVVG